LPQSGVATNYMEWVPSFLSFSKKVRNKFCERKDQNEPNGTIDYVPFFSKKATSKFLGKKGLK
jgi:hypothetical protein